MQSMQCVVPDLQFQQADTRASTKERRRHSSCCRRGPTASTCQYLEQGTNAYQVKEFGTLTGTKVLTGIKTHEDRAMRKSGVRFAKSAIRALTEWIVNHSDHPYPTEQEKDDLRQKTGLSETQMNNWFANARRRKKHMPRRMDSPGTAAIDIPNNPSWKDLNPMERWKISPPENEPAPLTAIAQAVRQQTPPLDNSSSTHTSRHGSSASSGPQSRRAPSSASLEVTSVNSAVSSQDDSFGSIFSFDSGNSRHSWGSFGSFGSFGPSGIRKDRRRRRRQEVKPKPVADEGRRMFRKSRNPLKSN